jgi:hypothetical protein
VILAPAAVEAAVELGWSATPASKAALAAWINLSALGNVADVYKKFGISIGAADRAA